MALPGFSLVGGTRQIGKTEYPGVVLLQIKQADIAVCHSQKRDRHDIVRADLLAGKDGKGLSEAFSAVSRYHTVQVRCARVSVSCASVTGIDEKNIAVFQGDERAFAVSVIRLTRSQIQNMLSEHL
jgi:hypothetical protein